MSVADAVPLDRINAEARGARPGRALLALVAAVFFVVGMVAAKLVFALVWCGCAVREGWRAGRGPQVSHGSS